MIRIVLADDHDLILKGFELMLDKQNEIQLAGFARNGQELVDLVEKLKPDVVVTDLQMPIMNGIAACKIIKGRYPELGVLALSTFGDDHSVVDMFEAGANGYLLKNTDRNELTEAIRAVYDGGAWFSKNLSRTLVRLISKSSYNPFTEKQPDELSPKEKEIIVMICEEFTNKEIAEKTNHSVRTIEGYRERIFEKTGARNIAGLVVYAIKHGIYKI